MDYQAAQNEMIGWRLLRIFNRQLPYVRVVAALRCGNKKVAADIVEVLGAGRVEGGSAMFEGRALTAALRALGAPPAIVTLHEAFEDARGVSGSRLEEIDRTAQVLAQEEFVAAWTSAIEARANRGLR